MCVCKISHGGKCLLRGRADMKGDTRKAYKILVGNSEGKNHSEGLEKDRSPFSKRHILVWGEFKVVTSCNTCPGKADHNTELIFETYCDIHYTPNSFCENVLK